MNREYLRTVQLLLVVAPTAESLWPRSTGSIRVISSMRSDA